MLQRRQAPSAADTFGMAVAAVPQVPKITAAKLKRAEKISKKISALREELAKLLNSTATKGA